MLVLLIVFSSIAEARTRRQRRRGPIATALRPLLLVRSAVHAVADPIVFNVPRAVATIATIPVRTHRRSQERIYQAQEAEAFSEEDEDDNDAPALQVAYYDARPRQPAPPRAEPADPMEEDAEEERSLRQTDEDEEFEEAAPTVSGRRAVLRNGVARAPAGAPTSVKNAIAAANSLRRKPYIWGGGHGSFRDRGYDCSGTVSFALHGAGALTAPLPSRDLMRYGERGRGRWITIYARPGHTFAVIAGLRLDTTDFRNGGNTGPRWHAEMRDTRGYVARHPAGM